MTIFFCQKFDVVTKVSIVLSTVSMAQHVLGTSIVLVLGIVDAFHSNVAKRAHNCVVTLDHGCPSLATIDDAVLHSLGASLLATGITSWVALHSHIERD